MFIPFISMIFISSFIIAAGLTTKIYPPPKYIIKDMIFQNNFTTQNEKAVEQCLKILSDFGIICGGASALLCISVVRLKAAVWFFAAIAALEVLSFLLVYLYIQKRILKT